MKPIKVAFINSSRIAKADIPEKMKQYIMHTADYLLNQLKVPKIYNVKNPFSFMHAINIDNKTNFFESRVTEYTKFGDMARPVEDEINVDDDF